MSEYCSRSRQQRIDRVHAVRIGDVLLVIPDTVEVVLRGDVVVEVGGEELAVVLARRLEREILAVVVAVGCDAILQRPGGRSRQLQVAVEDVEHHRISGGGVRANRRRQGSILRPREIEKAYLTKLPCSGVLVSENTLKHLRIRDSRRHTIGLRKAEVFVIDKEECAIFLEGPSEIDAGLVKVDDIAGEAVNGVEVVVRIEECVAVLPDGAAVEGVSSALG